MEWGEVDTEAATWTVPASRMKARREHRVPLSRRALAVLEEVREIGTGRGLVFPSRKGNPLSNMAFNMLRRRLEAGDAVPHGFRSTFKDWTLEETSFPWAVVEAALAHTLGSATESAYARSDLLAKRRELMETWARHCERGGVHITVAELPEDSCVVCHGTIPEERRGLETCSPCVCGDHGTGSEAGEFSGVAQTPGRQRGGTCGGGGGLSRRPCRRACDPQRRGKRWGSGCGLPGRLRHTRPVLAGAYRTSAYCSDAWYGATAAG